MKPVIMQALGLRFREAAVHLIGIPFRSIVRYSDTRVGKATVKGIPTSTVP